jgi:hypothetical protein
MKEEREKPGDMDLNEWNHEKELERRQSRGKIWLWVVAGIILFWFLWMAGV